jgi:hypothetical protein
VALVTLAGLSPFFANSLSAGLVASAFVLGGGGVVLLSITRARLDRLQHEYQEMQRAAKMLRTYVVANIPTKAKTVLWRDYQEIGRRGDTFSRVDLRLRVDPGRRPLHFLQVELDGESLTSGEQRRLEITARREPDGARLPVDWDWLAPSKVRFWIHFDTPIPPGDKVEVSYQYTWPHTFPKLSERGVEHTEWACERETERFEFTVRLDASHKRDSPLKITHHGIAAHALRQDRDGPGWKIEGAADNLPQNYVIALDLDAG